MKCNFTIEDYRNYYGSLEFQEDLKYWFDVNTTTEFPFIGSARRSHKTYSLLLSPSREDYRRGIPSSTKEKSFYFSFCIFLHCLQAQAIFKLSGNEMMNRFHAETGVPQISCGLGGVMHPAHTLSEAQLLPIFDEVEAYIKMIDIILPAVRPQVEELKEYANTNELYKIIEEEILAFRQRLEKGEEHPTYI